MFPVSLDLDHPAFFAGLESLRKITERMAVLKARGGAVAKLRGAALKLRAAAVFARLFLLPPIQHELRADVRMAPNW